MKTEMTSAIESWHVAGRELGIEVVAPFRFEVEGRQHECLAWVGHFGRERGLVLVGIAPPDFATDQTVREDAKRAGYQWSAIDLRTYAAFNREKFVEALLDWGFNDRELGELPDAARHLFALLGSKIESATMLDGGHARIEFSAGRALVLVNDAANYEAYRIVAPGHDVIV